MTEFKIISVEERLKEQRGIKGVILGPSGIGKTSQLYTLDPDKTLFIDMEAGDVAVADWPGATVRPRTWPECRDFAVFLGGPNPALPADAVYSQAHYDAVVENFGDPKLLDAYNTYFIDSITVASRLAFVWAQQQPEAFSDKTGKADIRSAYGLLGREMMGWLTHLQHTRGKNVWFVGILDQKVDDFNRATWVPQIEGSKTGLELPGIVDEVISMVQLAQEGGEPYRAFICQTVNEWGYPAKDRSGRLEVMEEPHLGKLMAKISGPVKPAQERISTNLPAPEQTEAA